MSHPTTALKPQKPYMTFCFYIHFNGCGVIQEPSSKMGGWGDLKTATWNGLNRHNGHFDKIQKNDERTFRDEQRKTVQICT